jgi:hypothetical protein
MKRSFAANDIRGLKFFKPVRALFERLRGEAAHPNRQLHFDEYVCLLLLYYFNPIVASLRGIQAVSDLDLIAKRFGVRRASLGSLSEASHVFDPEPLCAIFQELSQEVQARNAPRRPRGVPDDLEILCADGTLLDALPRMLWAVWLGPHQYAVKVHLQYDILRGVPTDATLTTGNGDEKVALQGTLKKNCVYVLDRGYMQYDLYRKIIASQSSFVSRVKCNVDYEVVENRDLSSEARQAGVESDQIVRMGGEQSGNRIEQPLRLIKVHVKNPPANNLKPRLARVSRKVKTVRVQEEEFDVWLATDRMDIPAESVALLYRYRWQVEIFFRWLKCTLGCRHLLAQSENGLQIQVYAALIASLLIVLWTKRKPNKRSLLMLGLYFQGWANLDEVLRHIRTLKSIS